MIRPAVIACAALLLAPAPAAAQLVRLQPGRGELGADVDGGWRRLKAGDRSSTIAYREWIQLPFTGTLFDPRFLTYRLTLRPTLRQQTATGFEDALGARQLGVSGQARLLGGRPVSLSVGLSRLAGSQNGGFGSRREFATTSWKGDLTVRNRVLPAQITVERTRARESWRNTPAAAPLERDLLQQVARLSAASSKTSVFVERLRYDEPFSGTTLNAWNAALAHTLRWGKGSHLTSGYERTDQTGTFRSARTVWSERLHLQHTRAVASDWTFRDADVRTGDFASSSRTLGLALSARVRRGLSAGLGGSRSTATADGVTDVLHSVTPRLAVSLGVPGGGRLDANATVGREWRGRSTDTSRRIVAVDEPHAVPPSRSFTLDRPFPDAATLVLRSGDRTIVYVEGADYLVTIAGDLLRVDVPPGSRIPAGGTVLATYAYTLPPDARAGATTAAWAATLRWGAFVIRHQRSLRSAGRLEGDDVLRGLADFDDQRLGATWTVRLPVGLLSADADARWRRLDARREREVVLGVSLGSASPRRLSTTVGGSWSFSRADSLVLRALRLTGTTIWRPAPAVQIVARLEAFQWTGTERGAERFAEAALGIDWQLGLTELRTHVVHHRRNQSAARADTRLTAGALRRF